MEKINRLYVILGMVITLGLFFGIASYGDEFNDATTITFSQPVQIPGEVLPAGTYLFRLANDGNDPNIVQVFNSDGTKLVATLDTIPTTRRQVTGHTAVTLAEQGLSAPDALLKWFYPGRLTGIRFVYPTHEAQGLTTDHHETVTANSPGTSAEAEARE